MEAPAEHVLNQQGVDQDPRTICALGSKDVDRLRQIIGLLDGYDHVEVGGEHAGSQQRQMVFRKMRCGFVDRALEHAPRGGGLATVAVGITDCHSQLQQLIG